MFFIHDKPYKWCTIYLHKSRELKNENIYKVEIKNNLQSQYDIYIYIYII